jgi:hypothetical protein
VERETQMIELMVALIVWLQSTATILEREKQ